MKFNNGGRWIALIAVSIGIVLWGTSGSNPGSVALAQSCSIQGTLAFRLSPSAGDANAGGQVQFNVLSGPISVTGSCPPLSFSLSAAPLSTITVIFNPSQGTLSPDGGVISTATVSVGSATPTGSYDLIVTVSVNSNFFSFTTDLTYRLSVTGAGTASSPRLQVSPTSLSFQAQAGGANPGPQTLTISNTGGAGLSWTAQADVDWVSLNPASGTVAAGASGVLQVQVRIGTLTAGTQQAKITITAPGADNSPFAVNVSLTLTPAPTPPRPPIAGNPLFVTSNGASSTGSGNGTLVKVDISSPLVPLKTEIVSHLDSPTDAVCGGKDGPVYFGDGASGKVYRVDQDGRNLTTLATVSAPEGLTLSPGGDLYISALDGIWRIPGGQGAAEHLAPAYSERPGGLVFLTRGPFAGDLLAVDAQGNRVVRFPAPQFNQPINFITTGLDGPLGIAVNSQGEVFVGNFNSKKIQHYSADGTFLEILGEKLQLRPYRPIHLEFGPDDTLYAAEWGDFAGQGWIASIATPGGQLTLITALVDAWGVGLC